MKNKSVVIILMMISLLVFTACNQAGSGDTQNNHQVSVTAEKNNETSEVEDVFKEITIANFRDVRNLSPHQYGGAMIVQDMLYEGLVAMDQEGNISGDLAESYTVSEDGMTYTFKIRKGVTFHDGEVLNAEAVKANFDALLGNFERHGWLESMRLMHTVQESGEDAVQVISEYEVQIKLADTYYPFIDELAMTRPYTMCSPKVFIDGGTKDGISDFIGTGPFKFGENHVDEYCILLANENYWGEVPAIDQVTIKVIPDAQTRVIALQSGEIDMIFGLDLIDSQSFVQMQEMDGFKGEMSVPLGTRTMLFNTNDAITGDVNVRKAITHATNKAAISEGLFEGTEKPADFLMAPSVPYSDVGLTPYAYDVELANKILEEAGWVLEDGSSVRTKDGQELLIDLYYDSDNVSEKSVCEFMQSEYTKIGMKVNIVGEESQANRDRIKAGDFQLVFNVSWGIPYDPHSFVGAMKQPVYGDYIAQQGLEMKETLDQRILEMLKSVDEDERQAHYKYIFETLHNEVVYLPLTYEHNRVIYNDDITGVTFNLSKYEIPFETMDRK